MAADDPPALINVHTLPVVTFAGGVKPPRRAKPTLGLEALKGLIILAIFSPNKKREDYPPLIIRLL